MSCHYTPLKWQVWPEQLALTVKNDKLFFSEQAAMDLNKLGPELIWNVVETRMTTFKKSTFLLQKDLNR